MNNDLSGPGSLSTPIMSINYPSSTSAISFKFNLMKRKKTRVTINYDLKKFLNWKTVSRLASVESKSSSLCNGNVTLSVKKIRENFFFINKFHCAIVSIASFYFKTTSTARWRGRSEISSWHIIRESCEL